MASHVRILMMLTSCEFLTCVGINLASRFVKGSSWFSTGYNSVVVCPWSLVCSVSGFASEPGAFRSASCWDGCASRFPSDCNIVGLTYNGHSWYTVGPLLITTPVPLSELRDVCPFGSSLLPMIVSRNRNVFGVCMDFVRYIIVRGATNTPLRPLLSNGVVYFGIFNQCRFLATTPSRTAESVWSVSVIWPWSDLSESGIVPSVPHIWQISKQFLLINCVLSCVWPSHGGVGSECASRWADILWLYVSRTIGLRRVSNVVVSGTDRLAWGWSSSVSDDRRAGEEFPSSVVCANSNRPGDVNAYDVMRPFQCNMITQHAYDLMYSMYHVACNINNHSALTYEEPPWGT